MSKCPAGKDKNSECCENVSGEENKQHKTTSTVEFACTPEREKGKGKKQTNKKRRKTRKREDYSEQNLTTK